MKTISVAVDDEDYEAFQRAAKALGRPTASLIREAMAHYRREHLARATPLERLPLFPGHRPTAALPGRGELYDEIFE
jgi:hypothetical protein